MNLCSERGAYYIRTADGRRTCLYIDPAACYRAVERGEVYTPAQYEAISVPRPTTKAGARAKRG